MRLKRFAQSCAATVKTAFPEPVLKGHLDDPERISLIYPDRDWALDSPLDERLPQVSDAGPAPASFRH